MGPLGEHARRLVTVLRDRPQNPLQRKGYYCDLSFGGEHIATVEGDSVVEALDVAQDWVRDNAPDWIL